MQNILIVCADKELRKDVSRHLGRELKYLYVDVDDILDYELLNKQDVALTKTAEVLEALEQKSINRALELKNCVITISRDLFVSNDNFKLFNDLVKVFVVLSKAHFVARVKSEDKYRLEQELAIYDNINKLITMHCNFSITKEIKSVEEISNEIIKELDKK
ncbi:MAG: hypothetical protein IJ371_02270 [Clostridia bacterium]|nr:hypothetical protein [Clostridia bacterium]